MFDESDLLPLSGLQHMVFCERQAALIHVEGSWAESSATVEGRFLHERVDEGRRETRGDLRIARSVPLRSLELGLSGIADVVEFHRCSAEKVGVLLPGASGFWQPFPVEYKRGRPKRHRADEVQLCAQGLCLEEMCQVTVGAGALFYGKTKRRLPVALSADLRALTRSVAARFRAMVASSITPAARLEKKCEDCSLLEVCRPDSGDRSTARYVRRLFRTEPDADLSGGEGGA